MGVRAKHVFRLDLDKTYLRTEFDTLKDLLHSALEAATDKRAYPGVAALVRALRKTRQHRVCILSGSPKQMRTVLAAKLALDGIEFDEFVLKNNLHNLLRLRFRALRSQVPFKLPALLESRAGILGQPMETLFGDDAEADGIIYCLYGDILAGKVDEHTLRLCLQAARAYPDQVERTLALADLVRGQKNQVERILIHLDKRSPTARFAHFGHRLVPVYNYFQAALIMYQDEHLECEHVWAVTKEMLGSSEFEKATLANSLQDLLRRGRLPEDVAIQLCNELRALSEPAFNGSDVAMIEEIATAMETRIRELGGSAPLEWPENDPELDYVALIDAEYNRNRRDHR